MVGRVISARSRALGTVVRIGRSNLGGVLDRILGVGVGHLGVIGDRVLLLAGIIGERKAERGIGLGDRRRNNVAVGVLNLNVGVREGLVRAELVGKGVAAHVSLDGAVVELHDPLDGGRRAAAVGRLGDHGVLGLLGRLLSVLALSVVACTPAIRGLVINVGDGGVVRGRERLHIRLVLDVIVAGRKIAERDGRVLAAHGHIALAGNFLAARIHKLERAVGKGEVRTDGIFDLDVGRIRTRRNLNGPGVAIVILVIRRAVPRLAHVAAKLGAANIAVLGVDGHGRGRAVEGDGLAAAITFVDTLELAVEVEISMGDRLAEIVLVVLEVGDVARNPPFANRGPVHEIGLIHIGNLDVVREPIHDIRVLKGRTCGVSEPHRERRIEILA